MTDQPAAAPEGERKPNKRDLAKAATAARLKAAARELFEIEGYAGTTIRDIATKAGLSTGAFFASWSSKEDAHFHIFGHYPIPPELGAELALALARLEIAAPDAEAHAARLVAQLRAESQLPPLQKPEGEADADAPKHLIPASWASLAPAQRFGKRITPDAVEHLRSGTLLRWAPEGLWEADDAFTPKRGELVAFTGAVQHNPAGAHLEVARIGLITGGTAIFPGGGWVHSAFQLVSDPISGVGQ